MVEHLIPMWIKMTALGSGSLSVVSAAEGANALAFAGVITAFSLIAATLFKLLLGLKTDLADERGRRQKAEDEVWALREALVRAGLPLPPSLLDAPNRSPR